MTTNKLHFARFEFKYILSEKLRYALETELKYFLEFDPFVENQLHNQYFVRSLYFDDPHYTNFYDKAEGLHSRSKFRIRTYRDVFSINTPQFLEVKGRYNNLVLKHRCPLNTSHFISSEHGRSLIKQLLCSVKHDAIGEKFQYDFYKKNLFPVALVDYFRRPYISRFDPEFRLTFDSKLRTTNTSSLFPVGSSSQFRSVLNGYTIMEVKFRRHIPSWFHRLIQAYDLKSQSVSKICYAMESLGIAEDV